MFIPPDHIVPKLKATERYAVIRELLQHLIGLGAVPRQAEELLFAAICHREETMSTGIGFGVAIPHATSNVVAERVMAMGRSSVGIDFASIDGQLAKVVVLMILPPFTRSPVA